jgi:hypothetical protein
MSQAGDVELLLGTRSRDEQTVGVLSADGSVYSGASEWKRELIGFADHDGSVYAGTKAWSRTQVGTVEIDGTVHSGDHLHYQEPIGRVEPDGTVSRLSHRLPERIGSVQPSDRRAGAALLLLLAERPSPTSIGSSPGTERTTQSAGTHRASSFTAGAMFGAAAERLRQERQHAKPGPPVTDTPPATNVPVRPRLSLSEILEDERNHPGTHPQHIHRVPGSVTYEQTPEADLVQPAPTVPHTGETFYGDDPEGDSEIERIIDALRKIGDADSVDGPNGLASSWRRKLLTVQELRGTYDRWLRLLDLAVRFMTPKS